MEVPKEWIIKDAFIEHENKRFALFSENNLHVMSYSAPIDEFLTKDQLLKKIHTHPLDKSAIPYVTSYYKEDWAFVCQVIKLKLYLQAILEYLLIQNL